MLIVSTAIVVTDQRLTQINNQRQIANAISTGASGLAYISNDYLLYQQSDQEILWQSRLSSISSDLSKLNSSDPEQQTLINNVNGDLQRLGTIFKNTVSLVDSIKNETGKVPTELKTASSRLAVQNQALAFDASVLSNSFDAEANQLKQSSNLLILVLLGSFGAYFVVFYYVVFGRTFRSLKKLQEGTKKIGSGNLDFSVASKSNDEIGELSQAFNQMTANLKTVTASKNDLQNEIEDRKKAEEKAQELQKAVQQERDRLSSLLNSITDEVWFADTNKKLTLANPSAIKEFMLDSLGTDDVENIAASFEVYRSDGTPRPVEEAPPLRALNGEVLRNYEEIVKTPSHKELRYRQVSSAPVRDNQGNIIGSVSVVRDITELKQLQNRLQKYSEDLEKLVEERTKQLKNAERLAAIGATAGMVGHDIRNPLQAITGDLYLIKTELAELPDHQQKKNALESVDEIQTNIDYINKIVADLQDYARPLNPRTQETNIKTSIQ